MRILLLFTATLFLFSCRISDKGEIDTSIVNNPLTASAEEVDLENMPQLTFETKVHDFGEISQGEKAEFRFHFENTGKTNLVITDVKASCGCTVLENWPKEPVLPGEKGFIDAIFNSENQTGYKTKNVTIISNTSPATTALTIKAIVVEPGEKK